MNTKKHEGKPHLTGEYRWGDNGQLVLLILFLGIWVTDSFFFHYSTFLQDRIPDLVRIPVAGMVLLCGWYLARNGMRMVFGTEREAPELIDYGVFRVVRHPIYTGALCFYLGASLITLSVASMLFWPVILAWYIYISRYEEKILTEAFGEAYREYRRRTGMLFPRIFRHIRPSS